MRGTRLALIVLGCALLGWAGLIRLAAQGDGPNGRLGYAPASLEPQRDLERRFQATVVETSIGDAHRALTRRPHMAGTPASRDIADHLQKTLTGFGLEVETLDYDAYLSYARGVTVEMTAPAPRRLQVREPALGGDPDSNHPELGDVFVAYSAPGDVTAPIVYVNYGLPDDYARLAASGVNVKGRIVLARYARSHRAVKVHTAQEAGAIGVILFSDPADDGAAKGPAWPRGYWRGEQMAQRGNAKFSWFWHGDPLTPGEPALAGATRLDPAKAPTLPRIPVVAIAAGEARHLLEALGGAVAPEGFRGGLPITYRTGPGDLRVRLAVEMTSGLRPIRNVVARLRGSAAPDRMILLGGHHDAWTFGGVDPGTGAAVLVEVARALGRLAANGWRPRRTIGVAFWDAEEFGLVGSTEFVEHRRRELQEQLIAYVNTDMYMAGHFDAGGVPSLRDFVVDVARDVPEGRGTVLDGWRAHESSRLPAEKRTPGGPPPELQLKTLGSGADFVPFQDHLGVPTLSVEFIGANGYGFGTYHSNFDSRLYVERIADPGFVQGSVLARVLGTLALRMANADVLPFRFSNAAARLEEAVGLAEGWMTPFAASGGRAHDLSRVRSAAGRIRTTAVALEQRIDQGLQNGRLAGAQAAALNDRLARLEQALCDDEGDPSSRWYRHVVHGWNIYSLYDGQPFPGLAEAIRRRDNARVAKEVDRIDRALTRMLAGLEEMAGLAAK